MKLKDRSKALDYFTKAAEIAEKLGDFEEKYNYNVFMGRMLLLLQRQKEAQDLLESIQLKIKDKITLAHCNGWLGFLYRIYKININEGISLIQKAIKTFEEIGDTENVKTFKTALNV